MPSRRRVSKTSRSRTAKYIRKVAAQQDRRELQRLEGKWYGFQLSTSLTTTAGGGFSTGLTLPRPAEMFVTAAKRKDYRGITIYGMNSVLTLAATKSGAPGTDFPVSGTLAGTVLKYDEATSLENPFPYESNPGAIGEDPSDRWNIRPWRWWQPFVVSLGPDDPKHVMSMPFAFRRGHRIHLSPDQRSRASGTPGHDQYVIVVGLNPRSGGSYTVQAHWFGRYRYVEKEL